MPLEEGTKALKTAAMSPELIHKLLDPNDSPATSREMPHRRSDCHISSSEERQERQAFIACKARDKGTAFLKGRRLKLSETQAGSGASGLLQVPNIRP